MKINGKQTVKLKSGSIKFKNHFKQSAVSFKIHAGFESILNVRNINASYIEKIDHIFLAALLSKLYVLMINLSKKLFFPEEKVQFIDLLKQS